MSPLLFVIVMDYLHRVLHKMGKNPGFKFHSKCDTLKIINLSFADDLLVFTRGDTKFVKLNMKMMVDYSEASGLQVNPS